MGEENGTFDVHLFWAVIFCGISGSFIPTVVKMALQIITRETEMEANLRRQACDLKAELGSISMVDEFAKYAKIKRKVNKVTNELSHQADIRSSFILKGKIIASIVLYSSLGCVVAFLLWNYRKSPVAIVPEEWIFPFGGLLSYPSGVPGEISLMAWLFICSTVGRVMARCLTI